MKTTHSWEKVLDAASGDVRRLSYVDRYTSIPVNIKENVAEHSYWVALYSAMIHEAVEGSDFYLPAILSHALAHDIVECVSGDLVRTFKYSTEELKAAVDAAEEKLAEGFSPVLKSVMGMAWRSIQDPSDKAYCKAVVKTADFVSLHQYMVREKMRSNLEISEFYDRMKVDLRMMGEKYKASSDTRIKHMAGLFEVMANTDTTAKRTT